jgi:NAD(P)-dependent dehydrogenase (short-subunit alcohol dehydrogenase family)
VTTSRDGLVEGKVVLVTGAGSGIGRATALLCGNEGAAVVVVSDVDEVGAVETAQLLEKGGREAMAVRTDVARVDEVDALIDTVVERYGRLDCAVNNAGVRGRAARLGDCTVDEWRRVVSVNLDGVFYCLRAELRAMRANGGGAIVNISSGTTADPKPELGPYVASKFGVLGLTRVAAGEYAIDNIRVNAVLPGSTRTPMLEEYLSLDPSVEAQVIAGMPQQRLGRPDELAEAIVWLCSPRSSFVNAVTLLVDGGLHSFAHGPRPAVAPSS